MEKRQLKDLDVAGVNAFLTTIHLENFFGSDFQQMQVDGEMLADGTPLSLFLCYFVCLAVRVCTARTVTLHYLGYMYFPEPTLGYIYI